MSGYSVNVMRLMGVGNKVYMVNLGLMRAVLSVVVCCGCSPSSSSSSSC